MEPMISNTGEERFLFGTVDTTGKTPVFTGAVVHGSGLTYDSENSQPTSGTIDRIDVQTRAAEDVLYTHASYTDINATVEQLNAAFEGADAPWYDAMLVIDETPDTDSVASHDVLAIADVATLDLTVDINSPQIANFLSNPSELLLETGEVLTALEVESIFAAVPAKAEPKADDVSASDSAEADDFLAMLDSATNNSQFYDFNDLDLDALENDLLLDVL